MHNWEVVAEDLFRPRAGQRVISFTKVNERWGWLGNMSPHPITIGEKRWPTAEALFQAMRFPEDSAVRELIRAQTSPMSAKMIAKKYRADRIVEPQSEQDVSQMTDILRLKLDQNRNDSEIARELRLLHQLDHPLIIEDCSKRARGSGLFWGAAFVDPGAGLWRGKNVLGQLWMEIVSGATEPLQK
jgi:predicted NAD-dependent protein-ADP-ribosyltransferase YbiA (DUF1768 family)